MTRSRHRRADGGFTLLEMVIAIMIMSVAVLTLVTALGSMLQLSGEHRGHAVNETGAHSFSQAVMAAGQFSTTLTAGVGVDPGDQTLQVADTTLFQTGQYVSVDLETMRITSVGSSSLGVSRAVNPGSSRLTHATGALVSRLLRCPREADLTPPMTSYAKAAGVAPPVVTAVDYWDPSAALFTPTSSPSCLAAYNVICSGAVLAECGSGLYRATIEITTNGDSRLGDLTTTSAVLIRTGGA